MKVDWQQLSPRERDVYLRLFSVRQKAAGPITVEGLPVAFLKPNSRRMRPAELASSRK
jgi:hypothetical protein